MVIWFHCECYDFLYFTLFAFFPPFVTYYDITWWFMTFCKTRQYNDTSVQKQARGNVEGLNELTLTLRCLSYFSLPFVQEGRVHLDLLIFGYFYVGISVRNLHHVCIQPKQSYISKKKQKTKNKKKKKTIKNVSFQNGGKTIVSRKKLT